MVSIIFISDPEFLLSDQQIKQVFFCLTQVWIWTCTIPRIIFLLYNNNCPLPFKRPFKRLDLFILICNCCIKEFFIGDIGISGCQQYNSQWSSALNLGWIPHKSMRSMATIQYVESKLFFVQFKVIYPKYACSPRFWQIRKLWRKCQCAADYYSPAQI